MLYTVLFIITGNINAQTCSSPIELPEWDMEWRYIDSFPSSERWLRFRAETNQMIIKAYIKDYQPINHDVIFYEDDCVNLTTLSTTITVQNDTLHILTPTLTINSNYLIKLVNYANPQYFIYSLAKYYVVSSSQMGCNTVTCFTTPACEYVCNGSFECLNQIPNGFSGIELGWVDNWNAPTQGSSDIFSPSSISLWSSAPCNFPRYSNTYTGNNYAGFFLSTSTPITWPATEYIQTQLIAPLQAGKTYSVSMWIKKATKALLLADELGIFLTPNQINNNSDFVITNYTPAGSVTNTVLLNDYVNWQNVTYTYTSLSGGEQFLTIGRTTSYGNPTILPAPPTPTCINTLTLSYSYLYIDEVSLKEVFVPTPTLSLNLPSNICQHETVSLNALATPTGGIFSGAGVTSVGQNYFFNFSQNLTPGTYTVTYTYTYNCTQSVSVSAQITVGNTNTVSAIPAYTLLCTNLGQSTLALSASATVSYNVIYTWQPGNLSGSVVVVSPSVSTVYTVTAYNVGCTGIATLAINVSTSCCTSSITAFEGTSFPTTTLSGLTYTAPLAFNNDVEIPSGVSVIFANSEFVFAPNVRLTVKNGANLQIRGSHLYACDTEMWQGIVVENGGKLSTIIGTPNTNLIEDAITAIDISGHTTSTLTGFGAILDANLVIFNKNLVAIKIATYQTSASVYPFKIANCVFTCRSLSYTPTSWPSSQTSGMRAASNPTNGLEVPYLLQNFPFTYLKSPYNYIPSETGIFLYAVGTTTSSTFRNIQIGSTASTADFNIFDGLQECIVALNSNVLSLNNVFQNTQRDYYFVPPFGPSYWAGGTAIMHSVDNTFNANLNLTANSTNPAFGNRFYNCHRAVQLYNTYNFDVRYATFRSTQSSTNTAYGPGNSGVLAQSNRFNYTINNNNVANIANPIAVHIWAGSYNFGTPLYGTYAAQLQIQNNYIGSQTTTAAGVTTQYVNQAIHLLSVVGNSFQAVNNAAVLTNTINRVFRGIEINNVSKTNYAINTSTNVITLLNDNIFNATQNAIRYTNNASGTVRGNTVSAVNTTNTLVTLFYAGGCTNNPTVTCNTLSNSWQAFEYNGPNSNVFWRGNKMNNHQRGLVLSNNGIIGTQGSSGNPIDNEYNGSWVGRNCTWTGGATTQASNSPMWVKNIGNLPFAPINNNGDFFIQSYGNGWINNTTGSYNCGSSGPPPSSMMMSSSSLLPSTANLNDEMDYIQNYTNYSHVKNENNLNSLNQNYTNSFSNSSVDKFYQLNAMHYNGQTASANALNSSISPTNAVEGNYKLFYELYGKFATDNFNAQDQFNLEQLAMLCPGTEGAVVYQARALKSYITKAVFSYNDNCDEVKYSARENTLESNNEITTRWNAELFPNPNQGSFTLVSKKPNEALLVYVKDVNGRVLHQTKIITDNFVYLLDLKLLNGIYFITIENEQHETITKKMVVTK